RPRISMLDSWIAFWEAGENPALPRNCKRNIGPVKTTVPPERDGKVGRARACSCQSQARRPARTVNDNPTRVQRRIALRNISLALFSCLLSVASLAADVSIHITDPDSRPVSGARIAVYQPENNHLVTTLTSDSSGTAVTGNIAPG